MLKLKDRINTYFELLNDEKFLQDKDKFINLLSSLELKENDFKNELKTLEENIALIEDRLETLNNYTLKSNANEERFNELKEGYKNLLDKYKSELLTLKEYIKLYNEVKEKTKQLI